MGNDRLKNLFKGLGGANSCSCGTSNWLEEETQENGKSKSEEGRNQKETISGTNKKNTSRGCCG